MSELQQNIDALLSLAEGLTSSKADALVLLSGTLTIACAKTKDPVAALQIMIDSLTQARDVARAKLVQVTGVAS